MNWNQKFLLLVLLSTFFILVDRWKCVAGNRLKPPKAQAAIIDLRHENLGKTNVLLDGEWKFYWESLGKNPKASDYFEYTKFPQLWKSTTWKGKSIPAQGFATYTVTILLPKTQEQLAIKIPEVYSSYFLFANDKLIATNGKPGTSKETTIPYWSNEVRTINTTNDTLNLTFQIANFHHVKGGASRGIEIGILSKIQSQSNLDQAFDYFLTGCIFMGGFFFLGLYLFGSHDKSILYFSLFCLCYSYRIIGSRKYTLHSMFPDLSWNFSVHCEYLSLFLAVAMFALYTRHLYPKDAPQKILSIMAGICLAFVLITIITPPILFTRLIDPFMAITVTYLAFATIIYWRAFKNKRLGATYALMSTGAIFIIVLSIILEYYDIATPFDLILFIGYLVFFFCQSLILTFRFAFTLKKAKEDAELGLKVKSEFLSTMSHEIRTPLNSVIGMTHLMIKDVPRPDQQEHLNVLLFSANNLLNIVNDVLDFSSIEEGKIRFNMSAMDITSIARNIISGYEASANNPDTDFILDVDGNLPSQILGDNTRTSQIIGNLVHNAAKFTSSGYVKLAIKEQSRQDQEVTLKISVEDTGIGIPLDKQKMIFERFTQADSSSSRGFGGTGLGLAISKRILELQGIDLRVQSEVNKGSVFYFQQTFTILKEHEENVVSQSATVDKFPLKNVEILIVEDNPMNVLVLQNFLKRWGAESEVAPNGKEALQIFDSSKHDIILMDLHMPIMDGYEATKSLRARGEKVAIVALTASVALDVEAQIFGIGIDDIVIKPFIPDNLLRVILEQIKPK